jgi:hypothetical protein
MRNTLIGLYFFCSTAVYAAPGLAPTVFDYRRIEYRQTQESTGTILEYANIASHNTGGSEVFDQSFSNSTGVAAQNSFMPIGETNTGPVFLHGTGSAAAISSLGLINRTLSSYEGTFHPTETFNGTLSGTIDMYIYVAAPVAPNVTVSLHEGDTFTTPIWSHESSSWEGHVTEDFSYSGTFEAGQQYALKIAANATGYAWESSPGGDLYSEDQWGSWEFTFALDVPFVDIDVLPGDEANKVYPNKAGKLPVAVLSSAEFDATQVDPATLKFGAGEATIDGAVSVINLDGQLGDDITAKFAVQESAIFCNDTEVTLTGTTYAGDHFAGIDAIDAAECETGGCHAY